MAAGQKKATAVLRSLGKKGQVFYFVLRRRRATKPKAAPPRRPIVALWSGTFETFTVMALRANSLPSLLTATNAKSYSPATEGSKLPPRKPIPRFQEFVKSKTKGRK